MPKKKTATLHFWKAKIRAWAVCSGVGIPKGVLAVDLALDEAETRSNICQ
jgi:hypothetical protein